MQKNAPVLAKEIDKANAQNNRFAELKSQGITYNQTYVNRYEKSVASSVVKLLQSQQETVNICEIGCGNGGNSMNILKRIATQIK